MTRSKRNLFKKGLIIVILLAIIAGLATCGVLYCEQRAKQPPPLSEADITIEITKGNTLIKVFMVKSEDMIKDGDNYILNTFYEYDGKYWQYRDEKPLKVTPLWGDVVIRERR